MDLPWVMKLRKDGHLVAEIVVYVDDGRTTGHSRDLTWRTARACAVISLENTQISRYAFEPAGTFIFRC